jgi:uncharacterized SAM-binding protein YcdF (DUF218 family)
MFMLKKFVAPLLFPLPLCFLLIAAGLVLLWFTRRQKTGKVLATSGFVLLVVLSYGLVSGPLLRALEHSIPPPSDAALAPAKWIVVLGGGSAPPNRPITSRANATTLARLVEGVRLQRQIAGSRLLVSGGAVFTAGSDAQAMAAIAATLGVPSASIVLDEQSLDTETQAVNVGRIVKDEPFVIVTSAYHMPRAMALFTKAGLRPVPAPAHYTTGTLDQAVGFSLPDAYPTIGGLLNAHIVEHEYLGTAWAKLRGKI